VASVSISCPSRSATDGVVRNGKSTAGHQRYLCSHCRKTWQLQFTYTASQPGTHQKIIDMAMNETVTDLIVVEIVLPKIVHFTSSPSDAYELTQKKKEYVAGRVAEGHTKKWTRYAV
jgi:transposase-like protein